RIRSSLAKPRSLGFLAGSPARREATRQAATPIPTPLRMRGWPPLPLPEPQSAVSSPISKGPTPARALDPSQFDQPEPTGEPACPETSGRANDVSLADPSFADTSPLELFAAAIAGPEGPGNGSRIVDDFCQLRIEMHKALEHADEDDDAQEFENYKSILNEFDSPDVVLLDRPPSRDSIASNDSFKNEATGLPDFSSNTHPVGPADAAVREDGSDGDNDDDNDERRDADLNSVEATPSAQRTSNTGVQAESPGAFFARRSGNLGSLMGREGVEDRPFWTTPKKDRYGRPIDPIDITPDDRAEKRFRNTGTPAGFRQVRTPLYESGLGNTDFAPRIADASTAAAASPLMGPVDGRPPLPPDKAAPPHPGKRAPLGLPARVLKGKASASAPAEEPLTAQELDDVWHGPSDPLAARLPKGQEEGERTNAHTSLPSEIVESLFNEAPPAFCQLPAAAPAVEGAVPPPRARQPIPPTRRPRAVEPKAKDVGKVVLPEAKLRRHLVRADAAARPISKPPRPTTLKSKLKVEPAVNRVTAPTIPPRPKVAHVDPPQPRPPPAPPGPTPEITLRNTIVLPARVPRPLTRPGGPVDSSIHSKDPILIRFPQTQYRLTARVPIHLKNLATAPAQWKLFPCGPTILDPSDDPNAAHAVEPGVFRVTVAAGRVDPGQTASVAVVFHPIVAGRYSQTMHLRVGTQALVVAFDGAAVGRGAAVGGRKIVPVDAGGSVDARDGVKATVRENEAAGAGGMRRSDEDEKISGPAMRTGRTDPAAGIVCRAVVGARQLPSSVDAGSSLRDVTEREMSHRDVADRTASRKETAGATAPRRGMHEPVKSGRDAAEPVKPRRDAAMSGRENAVSSHRDALPRREVADRTASRKEAAEAAAPLREMTEPVKPSRDAAEPVKPRRDAAISGLEDAVLSERDVTERALPRREVANRTASRKEAAEPLKPRRDSAEPVKPHRDAPMSGVEDAVSSHRDVTERVTSRRDVADRTASRKGAAEAAAPRREMAEALKPRRDAAEPIKPRRDAAMSGLENAVSSDRDVTELALPRREVVDRNASRKEAAEAAAPRREMAEPLHRRRDAAESATSFPHRDVTEGPMSRREVRDVPRKETVEAAAHRREVAEPIQPRRDAAESAVSGREVLAPSMAHNTPDPAVGSRHPAKAMDSDVGSENIAPARRPVPKAPKIAHSIDASVREAHESRDLPPRPRAGLGVVREEQAANPQVATMAKTHNAKARDTSVPAEFDERRGGPEAARPVEAFRFQSSALRTDGVRKTNTGGPGPALAATRARSVPGDAPAADPQPRQVPYRRLNRRDAPFAPPVVAPHPAPTTTSTSSDGIAVTRNGRPTSTLDFGRQPLGCARTLEIRLCNTSHVAVRVDLAVPGPFSVPAMSIIVEPRSFVPMPVAFCPADVGAYREALVVRRGSKETRVEVVGGGFAAHVTRELDGTRAGRKGVKVFEREAGADKARWQF
ncbi:hypothetical protein BDK51DRAFT_38450, partial [Blyttiomyces helicus]